MGGCVYLGAGQNFANFFFLHLGSCTDCYSLQQSPVARGYAATSTNGTTPSTSRSANGTSFPATTPAVAPGAFSGVLQGLSAAVSAILTPRGSPAASPPETHCVSATLLRLQQVAKVPPGQKDRG